MLNTSEVIKCAVPCLLLSMLFSNAIRAESPNVKTESAPPSVCPSTFYDVTLTGDASACHVFADELPASITYHSKLAPNELQHFFRQQLGGPVTQSLSQNRILMRQANDQTIIVISRDGTGSQVDILVNP